MQSNSKWAIWYRKNKKRIRPIANKKQNETRRANREAYNLYERERRQANPLREARKRSRYYQGRKKILIKLKSLPCTDCKRSFPHYVMDFDHARGKKKFIIAHGIHGRTLQDVLLEIKKCDLVCANCHRIRTHKRRTVL